MREALLDVAHDGAAHYTIEPRAHRPLELQRCALSERRLMCVRSAHVSTRVHCIALRGPFVRPCSVDLFAPLWVGRGACMPCVASCMLCVASYAYVACCALHSYIYAVPARATPSLPTSASRAAPPARMHTHYAHVHVCAHARTHSHSRVQARLRQCSHAPRRGSAILAMTMRRPNQVVTE